MATTFLPRAPRPFGRRALLASLLTTLATQLGAQALRSPELLADINPGIENPGSQTGPFARMAGDVYFIRYPAYREVELWRTGGTPSSTHRLRRWSNSSGVEEFGIVLGNKMLFTLGVGGLGFELWVTDGTANGTGLVRDIWPGAGHGYPHGFTEWNGRTYFIATDGQHGAELWTSDGTTAGTRLVADVRAGAFGAFRFGNSLVAAGSRLLMIADDGRHGAELWTSDGTANGTRVLVDVRPGPESGVQGASILSTADGRVWFAADDGTHGVEPWVSDGTATGTRLVTDLQPGPASSMTGLWHAASPNGTQLVFVADDGRIGDELWITDGTAAGTRVLADLTTGAAGSSIYGMRSWARHVAFELDRALWVSDGTTNGTVQLLDEAPAASLPFGRGALFRVDDPQFGPELWITDATPSGTRLVRDIYTGYLGSTASPELDLGNGRALLVAEDGLHGREPWITDGTAAGTRLYLDLTPADPTNGAPASSYPAELTTVGGTCAFVADDGVHGRELWHTDGSSNGTRLLADLAPGRSGSAPDQLVALPVGAVFAATDGPTGRELWRTDGTLAGTQRVLDLRPGPAASNPQRLRSIGDRVVFVADDGVHGIEPWVTDGTTPGTHLLADLRPGSDGSTPRPLATLGDQLLFVANDGLHGSELWTTDGTANGTRLVLDLTPGAGSSFRNTIGRPDGDELAAVLDGVAYFAAATAATGDELWRSDGTTAGTWLVADAIPGPNGLQPRHLVAHEDEIVFWSGAEFVLWRSDGTASGTVRLPWLAGFLGSRTLSALGSKWIYGHNAIFRLRSWLDPLSSITSWTSGATTARTLGSRHVVFEGHAWGSLFVEDRDAAMLFGTDATLLPDGRHGLVRPDDHVGTELWVADLGATTESFAAGCSTTGIPPTLSATDPVLGETSTFAVRGAASGANGALLLGPPVTRPSRIGTCNLWLDPNGPLVTLASLATPNGTWRRSFAIPDTANLLGLRLDGQVVLSTPTTGRITTSRPLRMRFGR